MVASDTHDPGTCRALADVLARVGDKWTVMVVGLLGDGPVRFNEIRRQIAGISQRMLTLTLRGLERDGLVRRTVYPTIPPRVEYELTDLGRTLIEPLASVAVWARANQPTVEAMRKKFDKRDRNGAERASPARSDRPQRRPSQP